MFHDWTYDSLPRVDKPVSKRERQFVEELEEEAVARMPGRMIRPKKWKRMASYFSELSSVCLGSIVTVLFIVI